MQTVLSYVLFWLVLMCLAIANGFIRETTYGSYLSELSAHQLSTLLGIGLFGLAVWLFSRWRSPASITQALHIGMIWLALTLGFEFLFGHFVAGHSWTRLVQDYDLLSGRVWLLFLVWIFFLPCFAFLWHNSAK